MAITEQSIEVYRGEEVTLPFRMLPAPFSIAGWEMLLTVARDDNSDDAKLFALDGVITDDVVGTFEFVLEEEHTDRAPGAYRWDVWRVNAGHHRLVALGTFTIHPDARLPEIP